jgi:hypothetical protein
MPRSLAIELDERAKKLRLTRTDYLRLLVLADLDRGGNLRIDLPEVPVEQIEAKRNAAKHDKNVPQPRVKKPRAARAAV